MVERVKRPFWLHQIAEYIVGAALIGSGLQSLSPAVPAALGGLVLFNSTCVDAPLSAFRIVNRRVHRMADVALVVIGVAATALPSLDLGTRIVQGCCVLVLATVVLNTNYASGKNHGTSSTPQEEHDADRADEFGRRAGRWAGSAAARARTSWRSRNNGDSGSR